MNIIYTRTSSLSSYKLLSPDRQIESIKNKYPELRNQEQLIFKEQCKATKSLKKRKEYSKILALGGKINQYVESVSRIGRSEEILNEFKEAQNITPYFSIGDEQVLRDRSATGDLLRKFKGKQQTDEAKVQTEQLKLKRKRAKEVGQKFDGRKSLTELYPNLNNILINNPDKSLRDIANQAYMENITNKGKKLSIEAIRKLRNKKD